MDKVTQSGEEFGSQSWINIRSTSSQDDTPYISTNATKKVTKKRKPKLEIPTTPFKIKRGNDASALIKPKLPNNQNYNTEHVEDKAASVLIKPKLPNNQNYNTEHIEDKAASVLIKPKLPNNQNYNTEHVEDKASSVLIKPKLLNNQNYNTEHVEDKAASLLIKPILPHYQNCNTKYVEDKAESALRRRYNNKYRYLYKNDTQYTNPMKKTSQNSTETPAVKPVIETQVVKQVIETSVNHVIETQVVKQVKETSGNHVTETPVNHVADPPVNHVADTPANHIADTSVNHVSKQIKHSDMVLKPKLPNYLNCNTKYVEDKAASALRRHYSNKYRYLSYKYNAQNVQTKKNITETPVNHVVKQIETSDTLLKPKLPNYLNCNTKYIEDKAASALRRHYSNKYRYLYKYGSLYAKPMKKTSQNSTETSVVKHVAETSVNHVTDTSVNHVAKQIEDNTGVVVGSEDDSLFSNILQGPLNFNDTDTLCQRYVGKEETEIPTENQN